VMRHGSGVRGGWWPRGQRSLLRASACCLLVAAAGWKPLGAQTVALPPAGDTYLRSGSPNHNQGDEESLRVQSSGNNRALVQFDPAAILAAVGSGSLAAARLELFIASNSDNWGPEGRTVDAHRLTVAWTEAGATWNCPDDSNPANGSPDCPAEWGGGRFEEEPSDTVLHTNGQGGWIAFDVTADVAAFLAGGNHHGWIVKKTEEGQNGRVDYASREAASGSGPRLVLVVESATFDEVPPRLAITAPAEPVLVNQTSPPVTLEYSDGGTGVDPGSLEVLLDGEDVTPTCSAGPAAASCTPGGLEAGPHAIEARLRDNAGNLATASFSFELLSGPGLHTVRLPIVADTYLRQGSPNQNQGGEAILRVRQSGKNRALLRVDAAELASLLAGTTIDSARLDLYIEDNGDNWGSAGRTVDLHRLSSSWTETGATWNCADDADPANQQPECSPQWDGGDFEAEATGSVLVSNGLRGWVGFDVTADVAAMAGGAAHQGWLLKKTDEGRSGRVEFTAREGAAAQASGVVVVFETETGGDTTPPLITVVSPAVGSLIAAQLPEIAASFEDEGAGVDPSRVRLFLDAVERTAEAQVGATGVVFQPLEALSEGLHTASVVVSDLTGNLSHRAWVFTVDPSPPTILLTAPAAGELTNQAQVQVAGEVHDSFGVAGVTLNGVPVVLTDGTFTTTLPLAEGVNLLEVEATDLAGNSRELTREVVRFSLPEVSIGSPEDLSTVAATAVDVQGTASVGTVGVTVNGIEATLTGTSFFASSVPLVEGGNVLTATATDALGHVVTDSVSVVRDLTPPRVAIYRPEDGATVFDPTIAVQGLVNDLVAGTVNASEVTVTVNGQPAQVANRSFLVESLPLALGDNPIEVVAVDEGGNSAHATVEVHRVDATASRAVAVSGSGQTAAIGTTLAEPLVVELQDGAGQPVAGRLVVFRVRGNDGVLDGGSRRAAVTTGADGRAQVGFTLGTRAGVGNQVVEASAAGFVGPAVFEASALPGPPSLIVVDAGDEQVGIAGRDLPRPLVAAVTDAGYNRLPGVAVRFAVTKGRGIFANGQQELVVATDSDGRAIVPFTLDPSEGIAGNVVDATIDGLAGGPAAGFVATGRSAGPPTETSISGVVLDNSTSRSPA
jgi:Glucodextranase, domain B